MTTISLVIPSYARADQLAVALESAHQQNRPFNEIVVVVRGDDEATNEMMLHRFERVVHVSEPGVLAAMRAGVDVTTSDIVAFTDDDARLPPQWSSQVLELFALPENTDVGAVGGRDRIFDDDLPRPTALTTRVGRVGWWGRLSGNHHRGAVNGRVVDVLKGVNAAYRREALGLPLELRGSGAEAHFEVAVGQYVQRHGWRLRYYSDLTVAHYPGVRRGEDQRLLPSDRAVADSAFNLMRALAPRRQSRRWLYVHLAGDAACPGLMRCAVAIVRQEKSVLARRRPSWRATSEAWRLRDQPLEFQSFS